MRHAQVLHEHVQELATSIRSVNALQHRRHLARLDGLQDLDNSLQVSILHASTTTSSA